MKAAKCICIAASLLFVAGCDMETLVRNKVPGPLKNLLTFGPTSPQAVKGRDGQPLPPKATIVQPAPNSVHPAGKEIFFRGTAKIPGQPGAKLDVTWTLFKDKDRRGTLLGKTPSARKILEPGNYRVEFAMTHQGQRVAKSIHFRVVYSVPGKVLTSDGKGLGGVKIVLSNLDQETEVFRTSSRPDGSFAVELPPEGYFLLAPHKKGFSFSPYQKIIRYQKEAAAAEFKATKGEIKNIRLTSSADSDEGLTSLCPNQDACIKFETESQEKPKRVEAFLTRIVSNKEDLTQLDQVKEPRASAPDHGGSGLQALAVRVPTDLRIGAKQVSCRVVLKVGDQRGGSFSVQAPGVVGVDLPNCFGKFISEAVALQQKGDLQAATKIYSLIADISKKLEDKAAFEPYVEKADFNRALADIGMAMALPEGEAKRREHLGKALSDLTSVLRLRKKDVQALLLRGVTKQLMGDAESSLGDFSAVLSVEPKAVDALKYKARGLIQTKMKKNLGPAVDDLTEAIDLEPGAKDLRKMRSETLKLLAKSQDAGEDATVDISGVPIGKIGNNLALENYLRK